MRLAMLFLMLVFSCSRAPTPPTGLVMALSSEPQSLDPRFGTDANSARVADLLHASLTRADATAARVPEIASAWHLPDPHTVVFRLRPDFRFGDGTPVTAADVKATFDAVRDPALASPKRASLAMVSGIETPDAATVVVRLSAPYAPFLDATGLGILPARLARQPGDVVTGAGPFRLVRSVRGERLDLEPNPGYPNGPSRLGPLAIRIVPDEVVRVLELRRGTLGFVQDAFEPEVLDWLRRRDELAVRQGPGTSVQYLAFNFRDRRLADRRVRRAIALAIDRDQLVTSVLGGAARPATGLLAPDHWAYGRADLPRHDPHRAARLLDRAGWRDPDGAGPAPRFRLVYKTSSQPSRRRLAEAIQAQLAAVGIALDVRTYEWGTLYAQIRAGNFELCSLAWVGIGDPDFYFFVFHSTMRPPAGFNRGGYDSPLMDRLTAEARVTTDPASRRALYGRIQRVAARELPVLPLWWEDRIVVHTRRLQGFEPSADGSLHGLVRASLTPGT
jgi:peptide/nickel transport system substrate-binding protein